MICFNNYVQYLCEIAGNTTTKPVKFYWYGNGFYELVAPTKETRP
jgi:hypothetical protein